MYMRKKMMDNLMKFWLLISVSITIGVSFFIIYHIFSNGWRSISLEFLLSSPKGMPLGTEGGIFPAIMGSLALGIISMLVASILGIATAIYLTFYCKSTAFHSFTRVVIQCIAGIPSIVLGLFGYAFFVVFLGMGYSLLAGALTLSIMIFPVVAVNTEKTLTEIRKEQMMASYALGVSKSYTFFKVILPYQKNDILSGILLGTLYAMGATAPIMLTAAVLSATTPSSLLQPVMALPYHLYILASTNISLENAYGTALVLLLILLISYTFATILFLRKSRDI